MDSRHTLRAAVYLILLNAKDEVLLLRRHNTGWMDGHWTLPAGHLELGESLAEAMIREAHEEVGVTVSNEDLSVIHVMHRRSDKFYIDVYYLATHWNGEPQNREPNKCDAVTWYTRQALPETLLPYLRSVIMEYPDNPVLSESLEPYDHDTQ